MAHLKSLNCIITIQSRRAAKIAPSKRAQPNIKNAILYTRKKGTLRRSASCHIASRSSWPTLPNIHTHTLHSANDTTNCAHCVKTITKSRVAAAGECVCVCFVDRWTQKKQHKTTKSINLVATGVATQWHAARCCPKCDAARFGMFLSVFFGLRWPPHLRHLSTYIECSRNHPHCGHAARVHTFYPSATRGATELRIRHHDQQARHTHITRISRTMHTLSTFECGIW